MNKAQGFENKPSTAGVPPATGLHVDSYSGHGDQVMTNKLNLSQLLTLMFGKTDVLKLLKAAN